jgi:hypothetical protein
MHAIQLEECASPYARAQLFLLVATVLLLSAAGSALADSATWSTSPGSRDWNTPANWSPMTVPNGPAVSVWAAIALLLAARGASAAFGGFGFALKTAATFDVFYWLQITNYGVLYVLFDSAPSGSDYIDVWHLCLHTQTASPIISSQRFSDESRRVQAEKLFDRLRKSCTHKRQRLSDPRSPPSIY